MEPVFRRPNFAPPAPPLTRRLLVYFRSGAYKSVLKSLWIVTWMLSAVVHSKWGIGVVIRSGDPDFGSILTTPFCISH